MNFFSSVDNMGNYGWRKLFYLILTFLLWHQNSFGQEKKNVYKWYLVCDGYWATFDSKKYTYEEIKNTVELADDCSPCILSTQSLAYELDDFNKLDLKALEIEYLKNLRELQNMKLVKLPYWEKKRQEKIKSLKDHYLLKKCEILAIEYPEALKNYHYEDANLKRLANILCSSNEKIIQEWKRIFSSQEDFGIKYNSKSKLKYAKMALINEWSNHTFKYNIITIDMKSIEKLFIKLEPLNEDDCE